MKRGNRLVIPLSNEGCMNRSFAFQGQVYHADIPERIELSLEECAAIVANMPMILNFIIEELPKEASKRCT